MIRRYFSYITDSGVSRLRRLLAAGLGLVGTGALALLVALVVLIPFTPGLGELQHLKVQRPTIIKAAGGETIAELGRHNRQWVTLGEIDSTVVEALIATEDHRFYEHKGVDPRRLAGAVARTLVGDRQGGSTITMQLARNLFPEKIGQSWGPVRKLKEIVTAFKIEYVYGKDEIIETYLNTVPFLYGVRGIERGAQMYFGVSADALRPEQAATLVGMLKATSYYNPVRNPERSRGRRNVVLSQMKKRGALDAESYAALKEKPLGVSFHASPRRPATRAAHFTERVRERLTAWADERGYNIYTDGLVVHTTLKMRLQEMAEEAVRDQMGALQAVADVEWGRSSAKVLAHAPDAYQRMQGRVESFGHFWRTEDRLVNRFIRDTRRFREIVAGGTSEEAALEQLRGDEAFMDSLRKAKTRLETGFVAIAPESGAVRAYVGSRDFLKDQYDHAGVARRQPGSTFKPFVYATALEEGFEPNDTFRDRPVTIQTADGDTWQPANAGGRTTGEPVSLRDGLAYSKNTVTVQLMREVGAGDVARTARRMGVRQSELERVPSLALGTSSVTLLEMVSAYATLARRGRYRAPVLIDRIESHDGQVLKTFGSEAKRVLAEETADDVIDMMRGVVDRGTGTNIRRVFGVRADVAGKTGTTQGGADGWFMLMHPELVAGAWVGFNDPRVTFRSSYWGQGAHNALRVVGDFYRQALRRGALSPHPKLAPVPEEETTGGASFVAEAGQWIKGAAQSAGQWIAGAARSAGRAIAGAVKGALEDGEETPAAPERRARERRAPPSRTASGEPSPSETQEAQPETWNETADERRERLERYHEEVEETRRREQDERRERLERYYEEAQEQAEERRDQAETLPPAEPVPSPERTDRRADQQPDRPPVRRDSARADTARSERVGW